MRTSSLERVVRLAALALFGAPGVHAAAMTSPLTYGTDYGKVMRTNGPCDFGQGSMQGSLNGGLAPLADASTRRTSPVSGPQIGLGYTACRI